MKALVDVSPTPEQLILFSRIRPGVEVIRGAAGSGKTTTAILKLRAAVGFYVNRAKRQGEGKKVNILVLTFNRTLRGYVYELTQKQIGDGGAINLTVSTFSSWAASLSGHKNYIEYPNAEIMRLCNELELPNDFLVEEVSYVLGKFTNDNLEDYLESRRDGRGSVPRMEKATRKKLLQKVVVPYLEYKTRFNYSDWHDNAISLFGAKHASYDVVVVDETQDFSANEVRAVMQQLSPEHTVTFVLDTAQRIYSRSFTWQEVGLTVRPENSHKLSKNYRNTKQVAKFAAAILKGVSAGNDGSLPDFSSAVREGELPVVIEGSYDSQLLYVMEYVKEHVNLETESVAFLHAKGGKWFNRLKQVLRRESFPYVEIARKSEWPTGNENIALSTMHSAKGLEFDYVFILGLNHEVIPVETEEGDDDNETFRKLQRLVAMAVGRSRKNVIIGYRADDAPAIAKLFSSEVCHMVSL